jgi:hypothetical protein
MKEFNEKTRRYPLQTSYLSRQIEMTRNEMIVFPCGDLFIRAIGCALPTRARRRGRFFITYAARIAGPLTMSKVQCIVEHATNKATSQIPAISYKVPQNGSIRAWRRLPYFYASLVAPDWGRLYPPLSPATWLSCCSNHHGFCRERSCLRNLALNSKALRSVARAEHRRAWHRAQTYEQSLEGKR